MTGMHTVADIYCVGCNTVLGWKYVGPPADRLASHSARAPSPAAWKRGREDGGGKCARSCRRVWLSGLEHCEREDESIARQAG